MTSLKTKMTDIDVEDLEFWVKAYPELTREEIEAILLIVDECDSSQSVTPN